MKKKIIILCHKMTKTLWSQMEFKELVSKHSAEVHECKNFLLPKRHSSMGESFKFKNTTKINSFSDWKKNMIHQMDVCKLENKKLILIDTISGFNHFGINLDWFLIYFFLKKNNIFFIKFHFPGLPIFNDFKKKFFLTEIKKYLNNIMALISRPNYYYRSILTIIYSILGKYLNLYPNIIFVAGKKNFEKISKLKIKSLKIVHISSQDFSNLLIKKQKKKDKFFLKNYALYLSDRNYNKFQETSIFDKKFKTSQTYYGWHKPLLNFFNFLEDALNIKVVIAAHPKSKLKETKKIFSPRKVYIDRTQQLTKKAKFVITLRSTAISYAAEYNKPIIFITGNELLNETKRFIEFLASYFKTKPVNVNHKFTNNIIKNYKRFDLNNLKRFKNEYITSLKKYKPNYKIILENIELI